MITGNIKQIKNFLKYKTRYKNKYLLEYSKYYWRIILFQKEKIVTPRDNKINMETTSFFLIFQRGNIPTLGKLEHPFRISTTFRV